MCGLVLCVFVLTAMDTRKLPPDRRPGAPDWPCGGFPILVWLSWFPWGPGTCINANTVPGTPRGPVWTMIHGTVPLPLAYFLLLPDPLEWHLYPPLDFFFFLKGFLSIMHFILHPGLLNSHFLSPVRKEIKEGEH